MTDSIYLLLGSNLGKRQQTLAKAVALISQRLGTLRQKSAIYETAPWGKPDQPTFLNQVICLESPLSPQEMLTGIQQIELELGRIRQEKWGERVIDIDILYFGEQKIGEPGLTVPHPEIQNRRFTLVPLTEIAPDYTHPVLGKTNRALLTLCPDNLSVNRFGPVKEDIK